MKVIVLVVLMHCGVETRAVQDGAQTPLYQMVDNSTAQSPTYERIRIQTTEDLDKLYALIRSYVLNPSLAETVKDVHIDTQDWPAGCYCRSDLEKEEQEHHVTSELQDSAQISLESYVRELGMDDDSTQAMIAALRAERRIETGAWTGPRNQRDAHRKEFGLAATAILLSLCTNIETISLGEVRPHGVLHQYFRRANYGLLGKPVFENLRHATFYGWELDERDYSRLEPLQYIQYFHRLPAVAAIDMDGVQDYQPWQTYFVPRTGTATKISITHTVFSSQMLADIIAMPKALGELKISFGGLWQAGGGVEVMDFAPISSALLEHKYSLHSLDMDFEMSQEFLTRYYHTPNRPYRLYQNNTYDAYEQDEEDEWLDGEKQEYDTFMRDLYGIQYLNLDEEHARASVVDNLMKKTLKRSHIASLKDFQVLKYLSISTTLIISPYERASLIESLPDSLEYLCFYGYRRGAHDLIDNAIDDLLENASVKFPNLKEIHGVEEMVPGLGQIYGSEPKEDNLYKRPYRKLYKGPGIELGWKEVKADKPHANHADKKS